MWRGSCRLDAWIVFDGTPLLDQDPKPTGDARAALFKTSDDKNADEGYHELRDCRLCGCACVVSLALGQTKHRRRLMRGERCGERQAGSTSA